MSSMTSKIWSAATASIAVGLFALALLSSLPRPASAQRPAHCRGGTSNFCGLERVCKRTGWFRKECTSYLLYWPPPSPPLCDQMSQAEATNEDWHTCRE